MKNLIKYSILTCMAFLTGCATTAGNQQNTTRVQGVYIAATAGSNLLTELSQDANKITELRLSKSGFRIIAPPNLDNRVPIQVCASNSKRPILNVELDRAINQNNCFKDGTGMAMERTFPPDYYVPLIISNGNAHNYYSDDRRSAKATETTVNINEIYATHGATISATYLIILIDRNQDHTISKDELWFAKITWQ